MVIEVLKTSSGFQWLTQLLVNLFVFIRFLNGRRIVCSFEQQKTLALTSTRIKLLRNWADY
jgi:hypothetical protein